MPAYLATNIEYVPISGIKLAEGGGSNSLENLLNLAFVYGIAIAVVLAIVMVTIGGIQYMGSESVFEKDGGKKKIQAAIGGLVLALVAWLILTLINPNLTRISLNVTSQNLEGEATDFLTPELPDFVSEAPPGTILIDDDGDGVPDRAVRGTPGVGGTGPSVGSRETGSEGSSHASVFGGPNDTGVSATETGSITFERLRGLSNTTDFYAAFPLTGHRVPGLPQVADTGSANRVLGQGYRLQVTHSNGLTANYRLIDRGPNLRLNNGTRIDISDAGFIYYGEGSNRLTNNLNNIRLLDPQGNVVPSTARLDGGGNWIGR